MGMIRSQTNHSGEIVEGVILGSPIGPVRLDGSPSQPGDSMLDMYWGWDDSGLPSGVMDAEGVLAPDEEGVNAHDG